MQESIQDILNFIPLRPNIGTAGQPTAEQFAEIAACGYGVVVNLAMPDSDNALAEEGRLVTEQGMNYVHIPVPWEAPTAGHLRAFIATMRAFADEKIFVHCAMNFRVSAFMYHYLQLTEEADETAASSSILTRWRPKMDEVWRGFIALDPTKLEHD